jgi:hypothetical protein
MFFAIFIESAASVERRFPRRYLLAVFGGLGFKDRAGDKKIIQGIECGFPSGIAHNVIAVTPISSQPTDRYSGSPSRPTHSIQYSQSDAFIDENQIRTVARHRGASAIEATIFDQFGHAPLLSFCGI